MSKIDGIQKDLSFFMKEYAKIREVKSRITETDLGKLGVPIDENDLQPSVRKELVDSYNAALVSNNFTNFLKYTSMAVPEFYPENDWVFIDKFNDMTKKAKNEIRSGTILEKINNFMLRFSKEENVKNASNSIRKNIFIDRSELKNYTTKEVLSPVDVFKFACAYNDRFQLLKNSENNISYLALIQDIFAGDMEHLELDEESNEVKSINKGGEISVSDFLNSKDIDSAYLNALKAYHVDIGDFLDAFQGRKAKEYAKNHQKGEQSVIDFDIRGVDPTERSNLGVKALKLAADQTYSVLAASIIRTKLGLMQGSAGEEVDINLNDISTKSQKIMGSLLALNTRTEGMSNTINVEDYAKSLNEILTRNFDPQKMSNEDFVTYKEQLVKVCIERGAFAASNKKEFLSKVADASLDKSIDANVPQISIEEEGSSLVTFPSNKENETRVCGRGFINIDNKCLPLYRTVKLTNNKEKLCLSLIPVSLDSTKAYINFQNKQEIEDFKNSASAIYPEFASQISKIKPNNVEELLSINDSKFAEALRNEVTEMEENELNSSVKKEVAKPAKAKVEEMDFKLGRTTEWYNRIRAQSKANIEKYFPIASIYDIKNYQSKNLSETQSDNNQQSEDSFVPPTDNNQQSENSFAPPTENNQQSENSSAPSVEENLKTKETNMETEDKKIKQESDSSNLTDKEIVLRLKDMYYPPLEK